MAYPSSRVIQASALGPIRIRLAQAGLSDEEAVIAALTGAISDVAASRLASEEQRQLFQDPDDMEWYVGPLA